jgi:hypothetical protein
MGLNDVDALAQRRARAEAEAARLRTLEGKARRSADSRAKIIVGATLLAHARHDAATRAWLLDVLRAAGLNERDRAALLAHDPGTFGGEGWHHG